MTMAPPGTTPYLHFTLEFRNCVDLFVTPIALKPAQAKYVMRARSIPEEGTKN